MLNEMQTDAIKRHVKTHGKVSVDTANTLVPGYVSCHGPVPRIQSAGILCRPEDYQDVVEMVRIESERITE